MVNNCASNSQQMLSCFLEKFLQRNLSQAIHDPPEVLTSSPALCSHPHSRKSRGPSISWFWFSQSLMTLQSLFFSLQPSYVPVVFTISWLQIPSLSNHTLHLQVDGWSWGCRSQAWGPASAPSPLLTVGKNSVELQSKSKLLEEFQIHMTRNHSISLSGGHRVRRQRKDSRLFSQRPINLLIFFYGNFS